MHLLILLLNSLTSCLSPVAVFRLSSMTLLFTDLFIFVFLRPRHTLVFFAFFLVAAAPAFVSLPKFCAAVMFASSPKLCAAAAFTYTPCCCCFSNESAFQLSPSLQLRRSHVHSNGVFRNKSPIRMLELDGCGVCLLVRVVCCFDFRKKSSRLLRHYSCGVLCPRSNVIFGFCAMAAVSASCLIFLSSSA